MRESEAVRDGSSPGGTPPDPQVWRGGVSAGPRDRGRGFVDVLHGIRERGEYVTVDSLLDTFRRSRRSVERGQDRALRSVAQLIDDVGELPPMLIEDFLPDRSLFLLAGKPKAGKSFLALDIADAVCQGSAVLGKYRVNRAGPVVYVGMEDGEIEIVKRLRQRGLCEGDKRRLYYITDSFVLTDEENLAEFREEVERLEPSLIVIDTAAEALGIRDWLNRSEIIDKVAPIRRLAREVCTVLLVAHNRKAEGDGGDEIAGSNAFAGAVDGWISTQRVERCANGNRRMFLRIEGRGGVRGEIVAEMDTLTLGFSVVVPEQLEAEARESHGCAVSAARKTRFEQVLRSIAALGDGATVTSIVSASGLSRSTAVRLLAEMVKCGEVEVGGWRPGGEAKDGKDGRSGRPAPVYRIGDRF